ncbi:transcriptional regulator, XRE family [Anaeromyxobacter sp. K]|uniref:helix-turn-helix domain-containing protein n=1 Tax=Anaeromyxobacter sp. (strain K) TaxID=447217 RepID=UPI00015F86EC|nr:helix-turn-helix transcriptional regulator [Anaeromyxobacter sp. K]ACG74555.1 transcriptional regulator, XRE family [Anaeromyxobacter sp. K]
MIPDLKKLREQAKMTQKDLADRIGIDQSQVSRYEADPDGINGALLLKWLDAVGMRVVIGDDTGPGSISSGVEAGEPFAELRARLDLLADYCGISGRSASDLGGALPDSAELARLVQTLRRKPTIGMFGRFDAGKSRTANGLLGKEYLPTAFQPATKLVTLVRHLEDRPNGIREEVWIMGPKFELDKANDAEHCKANRVVAGNLETLREYGTYGGRYEAENASAALVFVDAPMLRTCSVVDLPGFRNERDGADTDAKRAEAAFGLADVIIYVSMATGFLDGADLSYLSYLIRALPAFEARDPKFPVLGNLFIVATHAHPGIRESDLADLQDKAAKRLFLHIKDTSLKERSEAVGKTITLEDVRSRIFPFWAETPSRRRDLRDKLTETLKDHLPRAFRDNANLRVSEFRTRANQQVGEQIRAYEAMLADLASAKRKFEELNAAEPERKKRVQKKHARVEAAITSAKSASGAEWNRAYAAVANAEYLERLIENRFSKLDDGKNEAKRYAASYVMEILQGRLGQITEKHSTPLASEIEGFLGTYTDDQGRLPHVDVPFDARGAFVGGVAGAGVVGALAAWAASFGNLGAYILAAKAVSALSALGISVSGGTAGAMAAISALGGPVTLAIGIFVLAGIAAWALFGESWESRLAKRLEKELEAQRTKERLDASLTKFWDDTFGGFRKAADAVERKYEDQLRHLRSLVETPQHSRAEVEKALSAARELLGFFGNMPWRVV